jgi:hypothetical protein
MSFLEENMASLSSFGALPDANMARGITTTANSTTLTSQAAIFSATDVGKSVVIGFGPGTAKQKTTIAALISPTQITLATPATSTITNGGLSWGTDCSAALQAALTSMRDAGGGRLLIDGIFLLTEPVLQSFAAAFTETRASVIGSGTDSGIIIGTDANEDAISLANVAIEMVDFGLIGAVDATADAKRVLMLSSCSTVLTRVFLQGLLASEAVVLSTGGSLYQEQCNYGGTFVPGNGGYTQAVVDNVNWYAFHDRESSFIDYGYWRGLELSKTGQSSTLAWIRAQNPIGTLGARQEGVFELDGTRFDENTRSGVVVQSTGSRIQSVRLHGVRANVIDATLAGGMYIDNVRNVEVVNCAHGLAANDTRFGTFVNCTTVLVDRQRLSAKVNSIVATDVGSLTIKDSDPFKTYVFTRVGFRPVTTALGPYAVVKAGAISDADFPAPPAPFTRGYDTTTGREYFKSPAGGWAYYAIAGGTITGPELVTNGTFNAGVTGWTAQNGAVLSAVSSKLRVTSPNAYGLAYQKVTLEVGKTYQVSGEITNGTGPGNIQVGTGIGTGGYFATTASGSGSFVATQATAYVTLVMNSGSPGVYADFDNISIRAF